MTRRQDKPRKRTWSSSPSICTRVAFASDQTSAKMLSFRYPDPKQIRLDQVNSRLFLPKLGWLRYRNSRKVLGAMKNVAVVLSCGNTRWCVSRT
jgi:putative transposase